MPAMPARRNVAGASAVSLAEVQRRLEAIERRSDELRASQERGGEIVRVELGAMREALEGLRRAVDTLRARVDGLEGRLRDDLAVQREDYRGADESLRRELTARIDAVADKIDTVRAEMLAGFEAVRSEMGARFEAVRSEMGARFEAVDARFEAVDVKFEAVERRIDGLHGEMLVRFDGLRNEMVVRFGAVDESFRLVDKRFGLIDHRFEQIDRRLGRIEYFGVAIFAAVIFTPLLTAWGDEILAAFRGLLA